MYVWEIDSDVCLFVCFEGNRWGIWSFAAIRLHIETALHQGERARDP